MKGCIFIFIDQYFSVVGCHSEEKILTLITEQCQLYTFIVYSIVSAVHKARAARSQRLVHASTTDADESIINATTTTNLSEAAAVVTEVLNSLLNTIDSGDTSSAGTEDLSMNDENSVKGCSFAIDTVPTVELVTVKSEHAVVDEPVFKEDAPSVETSTTLVEVCVCS